MNKVIQDIEGTKITFNDGTKVKTVNIADIFRIDDAELTKEFANQASLYAYFATLATKAEFDSSLIELGQDQEYAQADGAYREEFEKDGRKYTEAVIKSMILTDENYIKLSESALGAKYDYKLLKAICTALEQRANMLISMGAYMRHEMDQTAMNIKQRAMDGAADEVKSAIRARKVSKQV
jgi:hypothetical protein